MRDDTFGGILESSSKEGMLSSRLAWIGLMGWAFILVMVLLVVVPTGSIAKLLGPFRVPVSAAGYGPLISVFAILAVFITLFAGFLIWIAMGRDYDAPPDGQVVP